MSSVVIKLSYFKPWSGKYYAEGQIDWEVSLALFRLHEFVQDLQLNGALPGLAASPTGRPHDYIVHIDASAHPHGFPMMVIPKSLTHNVRTDN